MKRDDLVKIDTLTYPVYIGSNLWHKIHEFIKPGIISGGVFILTDENVEKSCLPLIRQHVPLLAQQPVFSMSPGEQSKDPQTLEKVWKWLIGAGADRQSILINLGGGVVSDLGGFAAATFKRGMTFVNIPTSLSGQVDAAVGGKTGINIMGIKNQAGVFYNPSAVFIIPEFLKTLPFNHFISGLAEIIKSEALSGAGPWEQLKKGEKPEGALLQELIYRTVKFKCSIVSRDPFDQSERKILNFGHTVGHALESLFNRPGMPGMLHGEAVAKGMVCESYLSVQLAGLSIAERDEIVSVIKNYFKPEPINDQSFNELLKIMDHDKKGSPGYLNFSLLESLGKPRINCKANKMDILESFIYYNKLSQH